MSDRIEALINPEMLIWARETISLDIKTAAKKLVVNPDRLRQWELGNLRPTIRQLRTIASTYKRPTASFYLKELPTAIAALHDFRRLPSEGDVTSEAALALETRRARNKRELALESAPYTDQDIPDFTHSAHISDNKEELAIKIRNILDIQIDDQMRWKDKYQAFTSWRKAIEDTGVLVLQYYRVPIDVMRGFSIAAKTLPLIAINGHDWRAARIFSLIHEFAHLLLHNDGVCNFREYRADNSINQRTERFCNHIAGAVLVPTEVILDEELVRSTSKEHKWSLDEVKQLAGKFKVSLEAILRRLVIVGKCTVAHYNHMKSDFHIPPRKTKAGGPSRATLSLAQNGRLFTTIALDAYAKGSISKSSLCDYLGVQLKDIAEVEGKLWR